MLYLATSKLCVVVLSNCALSGTLVAGAALKRLFLGPLRDAEVERVFEKAKDALMETCLAMTIFREEFNASFVVLFVALLFAKVWHWLVTDRCEYIESTPAAGRGAHARVGALAACLAAADVAFLRYAVLSLLDKGPSVLLLFAFEYTILLTSLAAAAVKYGLHAADSWAEGGWEGKGVAVFYLELVTDLVNLLVYLAFFLIVFAYYGLPLHLVRELYWTARNFRGRVADFVRYRRVTANLNERFPDAPAAALAAGDAVCIICREEMADGAPGGLRAKRLPCGHCFHLACLRSWLERQQKNDREGAACILKRGS